MREKDSDSGWRANVSAALGLEVGKPGARGVVEEDVLYPPRKSTSGPAPATDRDRGPRWRLERQAAT